MDTAARETGGVLVAMLNISNLQVAYGEHVVLNDVSLLVARGEILALIGPNGAGKTTIIRAVSGTLPAVSGKVVIDGKSVTQLSTTARARLMAVVPQARQMGGAYTVRQAVMMGRTAYMSWLGRESMDDLKAVDQALEQTHLVAFSDRQIAKLSGGEQQRVLLARALAQSTPVLLLDEPTNHLDLRHQINLLRLVKKLVREKKLAVIFAMHDLNLVSAIADKVALLVDGEINAMGTPGEVLTCEIISHAYGVDVEVVQHPKSGVPMIISNLTSE